MPTLAQIQSLPSSPLSTLEREIVRHIIGIDGRTTSAVYIESTTRFDALSAEQCQLIRALISEYESIDNTTTALRGGEEGLDVSFNRDRELISQQIRRIMYPTAMHDPTETTGAYQPGSLAFIPITYNNGSAEFD